MRTISYATLSAFLAVLTLSPQLAHADPVDSFTVSGIDAFGGSATIDGYGTFDTLTGDIESIYLDAGGVVESGIDSESSNVSYTVGVDEGTFLLVSPLTTTSGTAFALDLSTDIFSGDVTVATTPEPSSIALLGTGLLGAVGAVRRRLAS